MSLSSVSASPLAADDPVDVTRSHGSHLDDPLQLLSVLVLVHKPFGVPGSPESSVESDTHPPLWGSRYLFLWLLRNDGGRDIYGRISQRST